MLSKICTKCKEPKEATPENFGLDRRLKDGLTSRCRECRRVRNKNYRAANEEKIVTREKGYRATHRGEHQARSRKYRATANGYLRNLYGCIKQRCKMQESYIGKGIKCRFTSDEFVEYIMNIMQVDPRGKDIHRIDNEGHYAPGNIEFLTQAEHGERHGRHFENCQEQQAVRRNS